MSPKAVTSPGARCFSVHHSFSRLRMGYLLLLVLSGCVSETKYEAVTSEMDRLRADLLRAQTEVQALEEQRQALSKLNSDGEKLLTSIRAELQQARIAYAEYRTEQNKIEGLKAKARALQSEHAKHIDDIKAAKRAERRMQAVIDRYEQDMGRVPDIGDMLRVSQAGEPNSSSSHLVASVKPVLPDVPAPASYGTSGAALSTATAPAPKAATDSASAATVSAPPAAPSSIVSVPSPTIAPVSTAAPTPKPALNIAPTAAPKPPAQPNPANDSWLASVSGWLSSFWSWLFS